MLDFLRKIRRSLVNSGSMQKYTLYAIGEITLVVIGILIAVNINNWNEDRKDRIKERSVLLELMKTLDRNCRDLERLLLNSRSSNSSSEIIISVLENKLPFDDSLNRHFHNARLLNSILTLSRVGYENLKNAGIDIIQTDTLRNEIIELYEGTYSLMNQIITYFSGIAQERQKLIDQLFVINDDQGQLTLVPFDFDKLLTDNNYLAVIKSIKVHRNFITSNLERSLRKSQRVLQLVNNELNYSK
jgi:hypothetical protein